MLYLSKTLPWVATTALTFVSLKGYWTLLSLLPLSMAAGLIYNRAMLTGLDDQVPKNLVITMYITGNDKLLFKLLNGKDIEVPYSDSEFRLDENALEAMKKYKLGVDMEKIFLNLTVKTPLEEHKLPLLVYTPTTDILDTQRLSYVFDHKIDELEKLLPQEKAKNPNITEINDSNRLVCENVPTLLSEEKADSKKTLAVTTLGSAAASALFFYFDYKTLGVITSWLCTGSLSTYVTIADGLKHNVNRRCTKMEFLDKETVRITINEDYTVEGKIDTLNLLNWNMWFKVKRNFEKDARTDPDLTLRCSIVDSKTNTLFYFDLLPCPKTSKVPNLDALEWILMGKPL